MQRMNEAHRDMKARLYAIIFESDTRAGRLFDLALMGAILLSLLAVVLDSVESIRANFHGPLQVTEWVFTLIFTAEYLARLYCVGNRLRYAVSFFGIVDLLAILPTYLSFFFPEVHVLIDVRVLRLLRIFRVLKLTKYIAEYSYLAQALRTSRRKILVFLSTVTMVVLIMGTVMYVVEGPQHGFTSIPTSVYWAVTTMTTVGFGDITPKSDLGRMIASVMMLMGWGILAVPTGIVTAEMVQHRQAVPGSVAPSRTCPHCLAEGLGTGDKFCRQCGTPLASWQDGMQDSTRGPQELTGPA